MAGITRCWSFGRQTDDVQRLHDMVTVVDCLMSSDTRPASRAESSASDSTRTPSPADRLTERSDKKNNKQQSKSLMFSIDSLLTHRSLPSVTSGSRKQRAVRSPDDSDCDEERKRIRVTAASPPPQSYLMPMPAWTQHPLLNNWIRSSAGPQSVPLLSPMLSPPAGHKLPQRGKDESDDCDDSDDDEQSEAGSEYSSPNHSSVTPDF